MNNYPWIYAIALLVLIVFIFARRRQRRIANAALGIVNRVDSAFQENHVFRQIQAQDYRWLTSSFYQQAQLECEANGFVWLADIEDETLTKTYPDLRTFARILVSPDYLTRAAIFEIVPGGPQGKVTRPPIQTRELISDTSDGASITTTTASTSNLLDPPPGLVRQNVPADTPIVAMMLIHQTAVDTYLSAHAGVIVEEIRNYEEATAAWQRSYDRQRARLNCQGGLSREEMQRFAGQNREKLADEIHAEMSKIKKGK